MHESAQHEIRQYAICIGSEIVSKWVPLAWEAFLDYRLNAVSFSSLELRLLSLIYARNHREVLELLREAGWANPSDDPPRLSREGIEFERKLSRLDIQIPWPRK
jgi:thymidylate synthase (FAD)